MAQNLLYMLNVSGELTKILVVDDDKLIRWSLKEIFSQEGYSVDTVATAKEALKQAKKITYKLIFADLEISNESGIEMLKNAKIHQPDARIIILSALTKQQIEPRLGNLNIYSIIEKPFKSEQIRTIVKRALDLANYEKGGGDQIRKKNKGKRL
jgi:DNA-binding NtrC family response regulator